MYLVSVLKMNVFLKMDFGRTGNVSGGEEGSSRNLSSPLVVRADSPHLPFLPFFQLASSTEGPTLTLPVFPTLFSFCKNISLVISNIP